MGLTMAKTARMDVSASNTMLTASRNPSAAARVSCPPSRLTRTPARTGRLSSAAPANTTCSIAALSAAPSISNWPARLIVGGGGKSSVGNVAIFASKRSQARCSLLPEGLSWMETAMAADLIWSASQFRKHVPAGPPCCGADPRQFYSTAGGPHPCTTSDPM
jgi:hypothetical protein